MRKTLEQLAQEKSYNIQYNINDNIVIDIEDAIKLLELVRLNTIQECANNALSDYNIVNADDRDEHTINGEVEVYVLKESVLQLDKNSVEIYEK